MKKLAILLMLIGGTGFSTPIIKTGHAVFGFDVEKQVPITKSIAVKLDTTGVSEIRIAGEDTLEATFENGKVSAYVAKPKKYFFYSLDFNPKKQSNGTAELIIRSQGGGGANLVYSVSYCNEGSTALLSAYAGDGSKDFFCATIK